MARPNPLTPKQQHVYDRLDAGKSVPEIAREMGITDSGVYAHMRKIKEAGRSLPTPPRPSAEEIITPGPAERNGSAASFDGVMEGMEAALRTERDGLEETRRAIDEIAARRTALEAELVKREHKIKRLERAALVLGEEDAQEMQEAHVA